MAFILDCPFANRRHHSHASGVSIMVLSASQEFFYGWIPACAGMTV